MKTMVSNMPTPEPSADIIPPNTPLSEDVLPRDETLPRQYITKLVAKHREIMRRVALGESPQAIADALGLTRRRINAIINSPLFQLKFETFQREMDIQTYDVMGALREIQPNAVEAMKDSIAQTDLPNLRFQAARDLLNRTGATVPKQHMIFKSTESYEQRLMQLRVEDDRTTPNAPTDDAIDADPIEIIGPDE